MFDSFFRKAPLESGRGRSAEYVKVTCTPHIWYVVTLYFALVSSSSFSSDGIAAVARTVVRSHHRAVGLDVQRFNTYLHCYPIGHHIPPLYCITRAVTCALQIGSFWFNTVVFNRRWAFRNAGTVDMFDSCFQKALTESNPASLRSIPRSYVRFAFDPPFRSTSLSASSSSYSFFSVVLTQTSHNKDINSMTAVFKSIATHTWSWGRRLKRLHLCRRQITSSPPLPRAQS